MPDFIDPQSAEIVLTYTGGAVPTDVPARDLGGGDLARIAYVRALTKSAGLVRPAPATPDELEALATELSSLGLFSRIAAALPEPPTPVAPPVIVQPAPEPAPVETPAEPEPAPTPEPPPTEAPAPPAQPEATT
jgi:outer membrane biosynthesis protein TonB